MNPPLNLQLTFLPLVTHKIALVERIPPSLQLFIPFPKWNFSRRHRCPHNLVAQDHLEIPRDEPVHAVTSYREEFDEKRVDRQTVYHHEDHLRMEGDFAGERRADYVATRGERAPVRKPQDNLRPEGEFVGRVREEAPTKGERAVVKRPRDNLRPEGEFVGRVREEAPTKGDRAPITRPRDNLRPEGEFDSEISILFAKQKNKNFVTILVLPVSLSSKRYHNHGAGVHRHPRRTA